MIDPRACLEAYLQARPAAACRLVRAYACSPALGEKVFEAIWDAAQLDDGRADATAAWDDVIEAFNSGPVH